MHARHAFDALFDLGDLFCDAWIEFSKPLRSSSVNGGSGCSFCKHSAPVNFFICGESGGLDSCARCSFKNAACKWMVGGLFAVRGSLQKCGAFTSFCRSKSADAELSSGESSSLIQDDGVDSSSGFQCSRLLDHDSQSSRCSECCNHCSGVCNQKRTWASHDQDGDRTHGCLIANFCNHALTGEEPN